MGQLSSIPLLHLPPPEHQGRKEGGFHVTRLTRLCGVMPCWGLAPRSSSVTGVNGSLVGHLILLDFSHKPSTQYRDVVDDCLLFRAQVEALPYAFYLYLFFLMDSIATCRKPRTNAVKKFSRRGGNGRVAARLSITSHLNFLEST